MDNRFLVVKNNEVLYKVDDFSAAGGIAEANDARVVTLSLPLPYGYKWYNGKIMSKQMTDAYNRLSQRIDGFKVSGLDAGRLEIARHRLVDMMDVID